MKIFSAFFSILLLSQVDSLTENQKLGSQFLVALHETMLACTGTVRSMLERDNMHLAAVVEELMRTCEFAKFYGDGKNLTEARWEAFWKGNKASKCEDGIRFCVEIKVSDDRFMIFIGMPDSKYERGWRLINYVDNYGPNFVPNY